MEYKDKTFYLTSRDNPRDSISVEIGDSKQADKFYPQVKIMRWDNKYNFSARLVHDEQDKDATEENGLIHWEGSKVAAHFYELTDDEGGFEFEVTLNEKPVSNVIEFTLETKGLLFFYQPELTQAEIDSGKSRPDNVIDSYAVYADERKVNTNYGKVYGTGKVGHIFRPKITDANGTWTWGELEIKDNPKKLSVTIPQAFLDNAAYPVTHAAGLTFGYTTAGASSEAIASNDMLGQYGSAASAGSVDSISACLTASTTRNIKGVTLLASTRAILTNGVTGAQATGVVTKTWITAAYSTKPTVTATNYYACFVINGSASLFYDTTDASYVYDPNSYTTPVAPAAGDIYTDRTVSVYATYTATSTSTQGMMMAW